jgi:hypothetical protein
MLAVGCLVLVLWRRWRNVPPTLPGPRTRPARCCRLWLGALCGKPWGTLAPGVSAAFYPPDADRQGRGFPRAWACWQPYPRLPSSPPPHHVASRHSPRLVGMGVAEEESTGPVWTLPCTTLVLTKAGGGSRPRRQPALMEGDAGAMASSRHVAAISVLLNLVASGSGECLACPGEASCTLTALCNGLVVPPTCNDRCSRCFPHQCASPHLQVADQGKRDGSGLGDWRRQRW